MNSAEMNDFPYVRHLCLPSLYLGLTVKFSGAAPWRPLQCLVGRLEHRQSARHVRILPVARRDAYRVGPPSPLPPEACSVRPVWAPPRVSWCSRIAMRTKAL